MLTISTHPSTNLLASPETLQSMETATWQQVWLQTYILNFVEANTTVTGARDPQPGLTNALLKNRQWNAMSHRLSQFFLSKKLSGRSLSSQLTRLLFNLSLLTFWLPKIGKLYIKSKTKTCTTLASIGFHFYQASMNLPFLSWFVRVTAPSTWLMWKTIIWRFWYNLKLILSEDKREPSSPMKMIASICTLPHSRI